MLVNNNEYLETIESIKQEIANARYKATASVNKELIILYYNIGWQTFNEFIAPCLVVVNNFTDIIVENGILRNLLKMAGLEMSLYIKLKADCMIVKN